MFAVDGETIRSRRLDRGWQDCLRSGFRRDIKARHTIRPGEIRATLPASARVHLHKEGLEDRRFYIALENPGVQRRLRYLYEGEFRRDFPDAVGGEVPPEAFHLEDLRAALKQFAYTLR